jgi:major type 1 subunit fimbrin (pilin)
LLAVALFGAVAAPTASFASDGTINFSGMLTDNTCKPSVNGTGKDGQVNLPTVSVDALAKKGDVTGDTHYQIKLSGCTGDLTNVAVYYEAGPTVDYETGNLVNALGDATNVEVQLLNAADGGKIELGAVDAASQNAAYMEIVGGEATLDYVARYYALGPTGPGSVETSVTYSLIYK